MPAYIQGNLALDQKQQRQQPKVRFKETTKVVYRAKTLPMQTKMFALFVVVFCALLAGGVVWPRVAAYQMSANILQMQKEIRVIEAENSALKQEVEKMKSPGRLKEEAKRLGLKPEEERQVSQSSANKSKAAGTAATAAKAASNR